MGKKEKKQRRLALQAAHARGYKDAMDDIDDKVEALRARMNDVIINAEVNNMVNADDLIEELKAIRHAAKFIIPKSGKKEERRTTILDLKNGFVDEVRDSLIDDELALDNDDIDAMVRAELNF